MILILADLNKTTEAQIPKQTKKYNRKEIINLE